MNPNTPFPFPNRNQKILIVLGLSVFVFLFLTIFEPFGISNIEFYKPLILLGYGLITLIVSLILFFVTPMLLPNYFDRDHWNVKKAFVFSFLGLLLITVLNWKYTEVLGNGLIDEKFTFLQFVFFTMTVGALAIIFIILLSERLLKHLKKLEAREWTSILLDKQKDKTAIDTTLFLGAKNHQIEVAVSDLYCIKSEGNYVMVYHLSQDKMIKKLLRCPLSQIKQQLSAHDFFKQCHRSFIVNFDHVKKVNGNARSYALEIVGLVFQVPVSRQFPKPLLKTLGQ